MLVKGMESVYFVVRRISRSRALQERDVNALRLHVSSYARCCHNVECLQIASHDGEQQVLGPVLFQRGAGGEFRLLCVLFG